MPSLFGHKELGRCGNTHPGRKTFIFDSAKQHFIQTRNRNALAFHLFTFMNYFRTKRDLFKKKHAWKHVELKNVNKHFK